MRYWIFIISSLFSHDIFSQGYVKNNTSYQGRKLHKYVQEKILGKVTKEIVEISYCSKYILQRVGLGIIFIPFACMSVNTIKFRLSVISTWKWINGSVQTRMWFLTALWICLTLSLPAYHYRQWKCWRIYTSAVAKAVASFQLFLGGAKFFLNFSMPPDYWKIGKNSILYVVIRRYS